MNKETATFVEITEITTFYVEQCKALEMQVSELIRLGDDMAKDLAESQSPEWDTVVKWNEFADSLEC